MFHILQLCDSIKEILPSDINPIADSVTVHLFISCVYGLIDKIVPVFRYCLAGIIMIYFLKL
jgi:hypothetical protein